MFWVVFWFLHFFCSVQKKDRGLPLDFFKIETAIWILSQLSQIHNKNTWTKWTQWRRALWMWPNPHKISTTDLRNWQNFSKIILTQKLFLNVRNLHMSHSSEVLKLSFKDNDFQRNFRLFRVFSAKSGVIFTKGYRFHGLKTWQDPTN
jgi:hypothetical protein